VPRRSARLLIRLQSSALACLWQRNNPSPGGNAGQKLPRLEARPGQKVEVALDVDRLHMFDPETEQAIGLPAAEERQETKAATQTGSE